jgi:hypothetical protein
MSVHGNFCIELHHSWNCSPTSFVQIRPNSPKQEDLTHWVGHDDKAVAISLCGFDCDNSTRTYRNNSNNGNNTTIENRTMVTIFDDAEALFKGTYTYNINIAYLHRHDLKMIFLNFNLCKDISKFSTFLPILMAVSI